MLVQCKGVEDRAAIKDTVESLNRLGYPELIVSSDDEFAVRSFRDAVAKELEERFGFRALHCLHRKTLLHLRTWWKTPSDKTERCERR